MIADRRIPTIAFAASIALSAGSASTAAAQIQVMDVAETTTDASGDAKLPFKIPKAPTNVIDQFEDFKRFAKRGSWEKAFESLTKVRQAKATGFLPDADGFYLTIDQRIQKVLADLPAGGRDAYRLFYDAEAKKLLSEASGKQEVAKLREVAGAFLATSVGDEAAQRLGDLCYEEGRFAEAADAWRAILERRPDSAISRARLWVRVGMAYARSGRRLEYEAALKSLRDRFPREKIRLGGVEHNAVEFLKKFGASVPTSAMVADSGDRPERWEADLSLPRSNEPLWKHAYYVQIPNVQNDPNMGGEVSIQQMLLTSVPAAVADEKRVYVSHGTVQFALDLSTGKLVWRTSRLSDMLKPENAQNLRVINRWGQQVASSVASRMWFSGKELWAMTPLGGGNQRGAAMRLSTIDPETGKSTWNSSAVSAFNTWPISGPPVIAGDRIYYTSTRQDSGSQVYAVCVRKSDGKLLWSTELGSHGIDPNMYYYNWQPSIGRVLLAGDRLYVETNAGALLELESERGTVRWAYAYESETPAPNYYYYQQQTTQSNTGPLLLSDGLLVSKGTKSHRIYAYRLDGPAVEWKRPAAQSAFTLSLGDRLYLGGEELTAFDSANRDLKWASRLPPGNPHPFPLETPTQFAYFSPRGVFVFSKANGDVGEVFRGDDLDSLGGRLVPTKKLLITVSNLAVTAYPIEAPASR